MSLTVSTVVAGVGGAISKIAEGAISIIKIVVSVGFALTFASAIMSLLGLVQSWVTSSIVGEVFAVLSLCLPFNAFTVFGGIYLMLVGILSFLIARRVYMLTMNLIGISG